MRRVVIAIVAVLFMFFVQNTWAGIIWSDGLETGNFGAWTLVDGNWATSGGNNHSGSKRAQVDGANSVESVLTKSKSTVGYSDISLDYWYRISDSLENSDFLYLEWTSNGADWQNLKTYTNVASSANWQEENLSLPAEAGNNPLFGLRFREKFNGASDCVYLDDVALSGNPVPEPSSLFLIFSGLFSLLVFLRPKR
jgi:hypothetical protein